jgi:hypothetical protein
MRVVACAYIRGMAVCLCLCMCLCPNSRLDACPLLELSSFTAGSMGLVLSYVMLGPLSVSLSLCIYLDAT